MRIQTYRNDHTSLTFSGCVFDTNCGESDTLNHITPKGEDLKGLIILSMNGDGDGDEIGA